MTGDYLCPAWRPAAYAQAIIVADALDWCGAYESILGLVDDILEIWQLMVRAEIFRIAIYDGFHRLGTDSLDAINGHLNTVDLLVRKLHEIERQ